MVFLEESGKVNTSRDCVVEPEGLLSAVDLVWPVVVVENGFVYPHRIICPACELRSPNAVVYGVNLHSSSPVSSRR
jgi:hypothetical protein